MEKILLAGATGYLGGYIAEELRKQGYFCRTLVRNPDRLRKKHLEPDEVFEAALTDREAIRQCCEGMDAVISTVGITRQKDGLRYMDVDYRANLNLLEEAMESGVRKFIYVSVLHGERLRHLKICQAKERFVDQLKASGLDYCVLRPNGFFSDMRDFFTMAVRGRVYLFGDGEQKINPIHGEDLARLCVDCLHGREKEMAVGGPEVLSHNAIARIAFETLGQEPRICYIPEWLRAGTLKVAGLFDRSRWYGPLEFFLTILTMDMQAPPCGHHRLKEYFSRLQDQLPFS